MSPSWSIHIWSDANEIFLEIPGPHPHTVTLPNNPAGMARAWAIINDHRPNDTIGMRGAPTKLQAVAYLGDDYAEAWLKANKPKTFRECPKMFTQTHRASVAEIMRGTK